MPNPAKVQELKLDHTRLNNRSTCAKAGTSSNIPVSFTLLERLSLKENDSHTFAPVIAMVLGCNYNIEKKRVATHAHLLRSHIHKSNISLSNIYKCAYQTVSRSILKLTAIEIKC